MKFLCLIFGKDYGLRLKGNKIILKREAETLSKQIIDKNVRNDKINTSDTPRSVKTGRVSPFGSQRKKDIQVEIN